MPAQGICLFHPFDGWRVLVGHADPKPGRLFYVLGGDRMANANVSLQILPRGKTDEEIYALVDKAIDVIRESGVRYEVGPLDTTMEGDYDELMDVVKRAQGAVRVAGRDEGSMIVKIEHKH